ncbi:checkpoint protein Hus1/Mec3 [Papiliotrema laurentii]|uniref:Checkpoint protein n=1 Tax=Papiliotrema laurentii TaxID=5418 RepID=A0AAD9CT42_PAPLA|nr:checkpoint protein Hus1/Mec3 [Papiliotrema laurentii]
MRFRTNIHNVALLHKIIRSLSTLARTCTIRLSPEQVHFIIPGNEGRDGVQVWSQVKVEMLFADYKIESNSANEIWLEVNLDSLLKVLRSADNSVGTSTEASRYNATSLSDCSVGLRLNKSGSQAIWSFDIRGESHAGKPMRISHDVHVTILSKRRQEELNEPLCPPPNIHLILPNLSELRNIVSRLSHIADDVKISANHEGTMELSVADARLDLSTTWRDLRVPTANSEPEDEAENVPDDQFFSTTVTIKGLLKFLNSYQVGGTAIACICERHCVIAYVYIGDVNAAGGVLTFFIPAKHSGDD